MPLLLYCCCYCCCCWCCYYCCCFCSCSCCFINVCTPVPRLYDDNRATQNWNRQKLVNFWPIAPKLGSLFIRISHIIWYDCSNVHIYQATVLKGAFVFANSAWSSMIWIVLCINFLFLYSLNVNTDWTHITTVISATTPRNSVLLCCIFMPYCRIFHYQYGIFELFFNMRQNITNYSTNSTYNWALK